MTGLLTIQHRGQDAAGIITYDGRKFHLVKSGGLVRDIFDEANTRLLSGNMGLGHVRYPTVGGGAEEDAQPFFVNVPWGIAIAHNGNIINYESLREELFNRDRRHLNSSCDAEVLLNVFADELGAQDGHSITPEAIFRAVEGVHRRVKGSYSAVASRSWAGGWSPSGTLTASSR